MAHEPSDAGSWHEKRRLLSVYPFYYQPVNLTSQVLKLLTSYPVYPENFETAEPPHICNIARQLLPPKHDLHWPEWVNLDTEEKQYI